MGEVEVGRAVQGKSFETVPFKWMKSRKYFKQEGRDVNVDGRPDIAGYPAKKFADAIMRPFTISDGSSSYVLYGSGKDARTYLPGQKVKCRPGKSEVRVFHYKSEFDYGNGILDCSEVSAHRLQNPMKAVFAEHSTRALDTIDRYLHEFSEIIATDLNVKLVLIRIGLKYKGATGKKSKRRYIREAITLLNSKLTSKSTPKLTTRQIDLLAGIVFKHRGKILKEFKKKIAANETSLRRIVSQAKKADDKGKSKIFNEEVKDQTFWALRFMGMQPREHAELDAIFNPKEDFGLYIATDHVENAVRVYYNLADIESATPNKPQQTTAP